MKQTVSSVTSVLTFVLTLLSVRSYLNDEEQKGANFPMLDVKGSGYDEGHEVPYAG